ncbi:MAG: hypothetical protein RLP44_20695 [Aggregatilineales bacterium]
MFKALIKEALKPNKSNEEGQGLVEYALILVLVAVVVIVVLLLMGPAIGNVFSEILDVVQGEVVAQDSPDDSPEDGDKCVDFYSADWHYVWIYDTGLATWERGGGDTPLPICDWSNFGDNGSYPFGVR